MKLKGKIRIISVVFLSGLLSVAGQSLLVRELLTVFQGNELTIGLMLSIWLAGGTTGSIWARSLSRAGGIHKTRQALQAMLAMWGPVLLGEFLFIRFFRVILGVLPGQVISVPGIIIGSLGGLFLTAGMTGMMYVFSVKWLESEGMDRSGGKAYFWESLGCLSGGIMFTMALFLNLRPGLVLPGSMVFTILALISITERRFAGAVLGISATLVTIFLNPLSSALEKYSLKGLYPRMEVREMVNSPYQQLAVIQRQGQLTLFAGGAPVSTLPDDDIQASEEFAGMGMLFHASPRRILMVGGAGRFIGQVLDRGAERVDYVETDPQLADLALRYQLPGSQPNSADKRLNVYSRDGKVFLKSVKERYDIIFIAAPEPYTIGLNRFYTQEFFELCRDHLLPDGVLVARLPGTAVSLEPGAVELNRIIWWTAAAVFGKTRILPGETNLLVAGMNEKLDDDAWLLTNYSQNLSGSCFLSGGYIEYRLTNGSERILLARLKEKPARVNRDTDPVAMAAALRIWYKMISPFMAKLYDLSVKIFWVVAGILILWFFSGKAGPAGTSLGSGIAGMSLQVMAILSLQAASGNIYYWIAMLTALYMAGLALGSWLGTQGTEEQIDGKMLASEAVIFVWLLIWMLLLRANIISTGLSFLLSAGSGLLIGLQYPWLVASLRLRTRGDETRSAGSIYATDMLGGMIGALTVGAIIIPLEGLTRAMTLVMAVKFISLWWWYRHQGK
jgi:spermidine synthase